jgi:hypothetical protein
VVTVAGGGVPQMLVEHVVDVSAAKREAVREVAAWRRP